MKLLGAGVDPSTVVTLMVLNYNGVELLSKYLPAVLNASRAAPVPCQVWVVDNASTDTSLRYIEDHHPEVCVYAAEQNRVLTTYNDAAKHCSSLYILLLNSDIGPEPDFISPLLERIKKEELAFSVSPLVTSDDESECYPVRRGGRFFHGHLAPLPLPPGPGACLYLHGGASLIHRQRFLELGGFDSRFFYMEDNDLSWRAWRRGYSCLFEPASRVFHEGGGTIGRNTTAMERRRALKEKANQLFVLKQIQEKSWLLNFLFWSILKSLKMLLTLDRQRAWAMKESLLLLPSIIQSRRQQPRLKDSLILKRIEAGSLKP